MKERKTLYNIEMHPPSPQYAARGFTKYQLTDNYHMVENGAGLDTDLPKNP